MSLLSTMQEHIHRALQNTQMKYVQRQISGCVWNIELPPPTKYINGDYA